MSIQTLSLSKFSETSPILFAIGFITLFEYVFQYNGIYLVYGAGIYFLFKMLGINNLVKYITSRLYNKTINILDTNYIDHLELLDEDGINAMYSFTKNIDKYLVKIEKRGDTCKLMLYRYKSVGGTKLLTEFNTDLYTINRANSIKKVEENYFINN